MNCLKVWHTELENAHTTRDRADQNLHQNDYTKCGIYGESKEFKWTLFATVYDIFIILSSSKTVLFSTCFSLNY